MGEQKPEATPVEISFGFTGNFPLRLDSAQRVAIPAKFKEVLDKKYGTSSGQVVMVPDAGRIKVLPLPVWERMQARLEQDADFDPSMDEFRTFIFGNMSVCQLDAQNRVRLTPSLCELGELAKDVVVVGQQDRMEIWDSARWKQFNLDTAKNLKTVRADVYRNRQMGSK